ncbi:MAG: NADPH-dependent glutamate synthase [Candidatus Thermoplasmatota archaeon]|nr:NADPH-dependent glutamate synthase [Candidatus Thermoplasmatota archaeon]
MPGFEGRVKMPEQPPEIRARNFQEVPFGLTEELALKEAERCLNCKNPLCMTGCPVAVKIPEFIQLIKQEKYAAAARKIKETNALPAVCGRVCPQESQCESKCVLGIKHQPVAIGYLERFCADYERDMGLTEVPEPAQPTGKKIAVIGSGPSGLTVAGDLIKLGHEVVIYEALHKAGGVLTYGIPEFRLPKKIVEAEVENLLKQGVRLDLDSVVGRVRTVDELMKEDGFDAVFIGVGAGLPTFLNIPGENLNNVYSANEYLTRANLMKAYRFPEYATPVERGKNVVVIGGGNVAMDSVRTALRLGAVEATIVYRRAKEQLPARAEEVHHTEQEGVKFTLLTNPIRFIGDETGCVKAMECQRMELGEPDSSGRRKPIPIEGSEFVIECDLAIVSIGTGPNPVIFSDLAGVDRNKWGYIDVNEETMETSKAFVYAGGDIVTGSATVIQAMGAGRIAARAIHQKLEDNKTG